MLLRCGLLLWLPFALLLAFTHAVAGDLRAACLKTNHDYVVHRDSGDVAAYAALFTEDAQFVMGETLVGREAIGRAMTQRWNQRRSRHFIQPVSIEATGPGTGEGLVYVTVYTAPRGESEGPVPFEGPQVGEYLDQYRIIDGACRIHRRQVKLVFTGPLSAG